MGASIAKMPPAAVARPTTNSGAWRETSIAPTGSSEMLIGCQWAPPPNQNALRAAGLPYPIRLPVLVVTAAVVAMCPQSKAPCPTHVADATWIRSYQPPDSLTWEITRLRGQGFPRFPARVSV